MSPNQITTEITVRQRTLSTIEKVGVRRLMESYIQTPHFTVASDVDMSELLKLKAQVNDRFPKQHVTITTMIVYILAQCLKKHEEITARYVEPDVIQYVDAINLGIAVDTSKGLTVPVIKKAETFSLFELAEMLKELFEKARRGRLSLDELTGGTFTLSNLGMYAVDWFTAIINPPQSAILAVGSVMDRPVAVEKKLLIRPIMNMTLTCDHRVIDGAKAARFLTDLKDSLDTPNIQFPDGSDQQA